MPWTPSRRTGYEAALIRVQRDLEKARDFADTSGDEGSVEDLVQIRVEVIRMARASMAERLPKAPRRQIPGQTKLGD